MEMYESDSFSFDERQARTDNQIICDVLSIRARSAAPQGLDDGPDFVLPMIRAAAGVALSVLSAADVPLKGHNFRGAHVCGAVLQSGLACYGCDMRRMTFESSVFHPDFLLTGAATTGAMILLPPSRAEQGWLIRPKNQADLLFTLSQGLILACSCSAGMIAVQTQGNPDKVDLYLTSGSFVTSLLAGQSVTCATFSPDGMLLATTGMNAEVRIWDVSSGRCTQQCQGHEQFVKHLEFSSDGQLLSSVSVDRTVRVWKVRHPSIVGWLRSSALVCTLNEVCRAASVCRDLVACALETGTIRLWRLSTRSVETVFEGHEEAVICVRFSPSARWLVSGSMDATVRLWDTVESDLCVRVFCGHRLHINDVTFSPNEDYIVSCDEGGGVCVWRLSGECVWKYHAPSNEKCWHVWYSPQHDTLVALFNKAVRVWALQARLRRLVPREMHNGTITMTAGPTPTVGPCPPMLVGTCATSLTSSLQQDTTVFVWDIEMRALCSVVSGDVRARISGLLPFPRLHDFLSTDVPAVDHPYPLPWGFDGWTTHTRTYSPLRQDVLTNLKLYSACVSPSGDLVALGGDSCRIYFCSAISGSLLAVAVGRGDEVATLCFRSSGDLLASASVDSTIRLWKLIRNVSPRGLLLSVKCVGIARGHIGEVETLSFSPDGSLISSGSSDRTVRLTRVLDCTCAAVLRGHTKGVGAVAFTPEGDFVLTGSRDHTIRLWSISGDCAALWELAFPFPISCFAIQWRCPTKPGHIVVGAGQSLFTAEIRSSSEARYSPQRLKESVMWICTGSSDSIVDDSLIDRENGQSLGHRWLSELREIIRVDSESLKIVNQCHRKSLFGRLWQS